MSNRLIEESPAKALIAFSLPLILGNVFQQLYNMMDSIIVGNYVGSDALAAVGASSTLTMLFVALATGGSIGASIVISQLFGAREYGRMKTAVNTAATSFLVLSVVLAAIGILLHKQLLVLLGTPPELMEDAALYLRIYFFGFVFLFMFNAFNAVFNALGDSKKPLLFLFICSVLNIGLNMLFVIKFKMGVSGVAWATFISQGVSVLLTMPVLFYKLRRFVAEDKPSLFDGGILLKICRVAGPSTLQQSVVSIGLICLQSVVNSFGPSAMAGYTAAGRIDSITILPMATMGNAVSTFTAQNIGAKRFDRIPRGYITAIRMVLGIGVGVAALLYVFGGTLVGLFVADNLENAEVIAVGTQYLRITSAFYFVFGMMCTHTGVLRGAGDMSGFLAITVFNFAFRVIMAFTLVRAVGMSAMALSNAIGWTIGLTIGFFRFRSGKWKTKSLI
ncbi:MAG TPA: MATE family efflux transporter [Clostridiales bacterium]|jgi:putative MATE family efflux protein|nr:MATE family efflux transporter [Clostridiales bacterium]